MAEYIEREALKKRYQRHLDASNTDMMSEAYYMACIDILDSIPAADVRPVVRGMWKTSLTEAGEFWANYCSVCNAYVPYGMEWEPNFCPNCGADMRR